MNKNSVLMRSIDEMSIMDLAKVVAALQKSLGVPISAYGNSGVSQTANAPAAQQTSFSVVCESVPMDKKIAAIKMIRETMNIGLKEAKEFVDGLPKTVSEALDKDQAEKMKEKLSTAGLVVVLK